MALFWKEKREEISWSAEKLHAFTCKGHYCEENDNLYWNFPKGTTTKAQSFKTHSYWSNTCDMGWLNIRRLVTWGWLNIQYKGLLGELANKLVAVRCEWTSTLAWSITTASSLQSLQCSEDRAPHRVCLNISMWSLLTKCLHWFSKRTNPKTESCIFEECWKITNSAYLIPSSWLVNIFTNRTHNTNWTAMPT